MRSNDLAVPDVPSPRTDLEVKVGQTKLTYAIPLVSPNWQMSPSAQPCGNQCGRGDCH